MRNLLDFGDVAALQELPDSEGVALRATETERVGKLAPHSGPELSLLIVGQPKKAIVVRLKLFILLGILREGPPLAVARLRVSGSEVCASAAVAALEVGSVGYPQMLVVGNTCLAL